MFRRHPILAVATLGYLGLVAWLTLTPQTGLRQDSIIWRVIALLDGVPGTSWVSFSRLEFLANVAMFVPIGLFFVLLLGRSLWWLAVVTGVALTFGIEFAQQFITGRVSDPRDLLSNSLGTLIGTLLALVLTAPEARRRRLATRVAAGRPIGG